MGRGCTTTALSLLLAMLAEVAVAADPAGGQKELDEVVVRGTAVQLNQLRDEIREAEDLFFERFNELNTVRDFDVHCGMQTPTGTRLAKRKCRAVFEEEALQEEGQDALAIRQFLAVPGKTSGGPTIKSSPPTPPSVRINARRPAFQQHMKDLVSRDPELARLLRERQELADRYDALRREVFGPEGDR